MDHGYGSYLVRVYRSGSTDPVARVVVEEIQSGREVELRGEAAARLVATIVEVVAGSAKAERGRHSIEA